MDKAYLTVKEVANILGVTPLTIRNWDKKGKLTAHRNPINNYRVYKREEIEAFLEKIEAPQPKRPEKPLNSHLGTKHPSGLDKAQDKPPKVKKLKVRFLD